MYRLFYIDENNKFHFKIIESIISAEEYNVYYLTDMCGNVIIDNRK